MVLHKVSAGRDRTSDRTVQQTVMAELTAQTHSHSGIGMRNKTEWTKGRRSQGKAELAIFVKLQMCQYHVTFHLNLELEHTLDAGSPGDHLVQVWSRSGHFSARKSDLRKKFTDGQTGRHADRQTYGRRTPRHCILSSVFCLGWQVYDALFFHQFLSSTSLFKSSQDLLITPLSICSCFLPIVVFPFILPSIISRKSESCLRLCPIHLNLRCCTVFKMILFSCTFCSTSAFDTLVYPADL